MIRLERGDLKSPAQWDEKVREKLPEAFEKRAREFEELPLSTEERRDGFREFAPEVLPKIKGKSDFPPLWRQERYVKEAIGEMSAEHCAYCQSPSGADQFGQVEHFKPKSLFPSLAYDWDNYFYSCELCNHHKLDKWPAEGGYVRPDEGRPESRFVFLESGKVISAMGDDEAAVTIDDFGLDRKGLRRKRRLAVEKTLRLARAIIEARLDLNQRRELMKTLLPSPLSSYSVAIDQSVRQLWQRLASKSPGEP